MKRFALPLAILAVCAALQAQPAAGDNPPPGLLAKIQISTQAHQQDSQSAGREFKDMKKFAKENQQARHGGTANVQVKKHGSLDVSKLTRDRAHTPAAIGKGIGHVNDGGEDR